MPVKPELLPEAVWDSVSDPTRREAIAALSTLDARQDGDLDRLTKLAASIFDAPVSLISVVDIEWQWFKSHHGTDIDETPVGQSFCAHAIADKAAPVMVINDARADPRFANNPLVTGEPHIRFYAGAPITVHGHRLGTLCVLSPQPRVHVEQKLLDQLIDLANTAGALFELKEEARVRARTAAELIKEEWRHALTLEAGKVGSWVWDTGDGRVVINDIMRRMFGLGGEGKVAIEDIFAAIHAADMPEVEAALKRTFEEGVDYVAEFRIEATGRWLVSRGRVYQRDADGRPLVVMGVNLDITDARQSADNTKLLLRELNHRVKNTLAMIQSLARQTMRQNPDPERFMAAFSGRLRTLSDAHALLADRDWSGIRLLEVIRSAVLPYVEEGDQIRIDGPDVHLPPDHALGLGLTLHELASNAARFGALSVREGRLSITWQHLTEPTARIVLDWRESGGPTIAQPVDSGFGTRLIERSLDKVLDSKVMLNFEPTGATARIEVPLVDPR